MERTAADDDLAGSRILIVEHDPGVRLLLEQILACHPEVEGTMELPNIPNYVRDLDDAVPTRDGYPESLAQLAPAQLAALGDRIITIRNRSGFNAFAQTSLEDTLRSHGVRHVLIAGSFTSMCVDSSGRAAFDLGFDVTILTDCIVGRTKFEDEFYCSSIFPLYANTATSSQMLEQLRGSGAD